MLSVIYLQTACHFAVDVSLARHLLYSYVYTALQSQKAVSAYFTSEQILPFGFAGQYTAYTVHVRILVFIVMLFHDLN